MNRKIQGYPPFVYDFLQHNHRHDRVTEWVRNSELLISGFGAYRAIIYHDRIILLQDVITGVVADFRNIYPTLEDVLTAEYIVNYFLKIVTHTEVITVYYERPNHYYYWEEGE